MESYTSLGLECTTLPSENISTPPLCTDHTPKMCDAVNGVERELNQSIRYSSHITKVHFTLCCSQLTKPKLKPRLAEWNTSAIRVRCHRKRTKQSGRWLVWPAQPRFFIARKHCILLVCFRSAFLLLDFLLLTFLLLYQVQVQVRY